MVTPAAPLRIVFFGTPEFAIPTLLALLESRHTVAAVVTQPDRARGRGHRAHAAPVKQLALDRGVAILEPERLREEPFLASLRAIDADLGVVAAYGKILTDAVLQIPRLGLLNVHASLLPKFRGAAPIHRAVLAGETETGVTIMRVVKALDAGPMIAKVKWPISPDDTAIEIETELARLGARALVDAVDALEDGRAVETPQEDAEATYAHKIEKSDGIIDWANPAIQIHNQIRGLHPWPHAFSDLSGQRLILLRSRVEAIGSGERAAEPGTILDANGDRLTVQTGEGVLRLLVMQREGRRPVSAQEFLSGRLTAPGEKFVRSHTGA